MMFGRAIHNGLRHLFFISTLGYAFGSLAAQETPSDLKTQTLDHALEALSQCHSFRIPYREKRQIKSLKVPLVSAGYLEFVPPDTLIKTVTEPRPVTYLLSRDEIRLTDETTTESRSLSPDAVPELAYLGSGLRSLLSGDKQGLIRYWTVSIGGSNLNWRMNLVPINAIETGLRMVEIEGHKGELKKLHVEAIDGTITDLSLSPK